MNPFSQVSEGRRDASPNANRRASTRHRGEKAAYAPVDRLKKGVTRCRFERLSLAKVTRTRQNSIDDIV
jgi:hypothetical protein